MNIKHDVDNINYILSTDFLSYKGYVKYIKFIIIIL